jgi:hypothetical protein
MGSSGSLYPWILHPQMQSTIDGKIPKDYTSTGHVCTFLLSLSPEQYTNYLHSIYIVFGIIRNLEMI